MNREETEKLREKYLKKFYNAPNELQLRRLIKEKDLANFASFYRFMQGEHTLSIKKCEIISKESDKKALELIEKLQRFINT
ncbi:MAG: hypothetical protein RR623_08045 [Bacilli bacterium]